MVVVVMIVVVLVMAGRSADHHQGAQGPGRLAWGEGPDLDAVADALHEQRARGSFNEALDA